MEVVGIARGPDRVGIALCLDPVVCLAALIVKKVKMQYRRQPCPAGIEDPVRVTTGRCNPA